MNFQDLQTDFQNLNLTGRPSSIRLIDESDLLEFMPNSTKRVHAPTGSSTRKHLPPFEEFVKHYSFEFGQTNPQVMNNPFWLYMAQNPKISAYKIMMDYDSQGSDLEFIDKAVYTHDRFGAAEVALPNGDIIKIGGGHEDYYDPNYCVYNEVVRYGDKGEVTIYGYPEEVLQPMYNHTATYVPSQNAIYIIGGYQENREMGDTLVYKLDLNTFSIECVPTIGAKPGWIMEHSCSLGKDENAVVVRHGKISWNGEDGRLRSVKNRSVFKLNLATFVWEMK